MNGCRNKLGMKRRGGFILVSVLLLCVMLVASATAYAWFARGQIRTAAQDKLTVQARSIAFLLTREALKGLKLDTNDFDSLHEEWFQPMIIPIDGFGTASLILKPLDNKIPLRHLLNPDGETQRGELRDIWERVWLEIGDRTLPPKVLDYIDKDTNPRLGGNDGPDNLNRDILDISELLGIEGMTPEILYGEDLTIRRPGLADYCTMWGDTKININTAESQVLAVLNGLDRNSAEEVVKFSARQDITSEADLNSIPSFPAQAVPLVMNLIGFKSSYFNLKIELMNEDGSSAKYFDVILNKPNGLILRWEEM